MNAPDPLAPASTPSLPHTALHHALHPVLQPGMHHALHHTLHHAVHPVSHDMGHPALPDASHGVPHRPALSAWAATPGIGPSPPAAAACLARPSAASPVLLGTALGGCPSTPRSVGSPSPIEARAQDGSPDRSPALRQGTPAGRWTEDADAAAARPAPSGLRSAAASPGRRTTPPLARGPAELAPPPSGHVTLAGAGPGDPDLLTVKALRAIESADVVLHDQLVSPEILALIPPAAERIDVGKTCGHHRYTQAAIIELMLGLARQGRRVLRLKGGDPHIFGRGGEEAQALAAAGVPFDFIPGISAAQAAASCAGIPLTHRDHARAVVYATAHLREDGRTPAHGPEPDWPALARPGQTVVLYMGASCVDRICERLREHGLPADTPVALVERASRPGQRTLRGSLLTLPSVAAQAAVQGPALIIVGSVVRLAEVLSPQASRARAQAY